MKVTVEFKLQFDHPIKVWVLQLGGWKPIQLSDVNILLVDRNITSAISKIIENPDRQDMVKERWWLNQLNSERYLLNPYLCAFEGKTRKTPTYIEFLSELEFLYETLALGLPKARLLRQDSKHLNSAYQNIVDITNRKNREIIFLTQIASLIASNVPNCETEKVEKIIIESARSQNLELRSLVVIAALSCLYEPLYGQQPRIGREVLKPHHEYSISNAYGAISDLNSLEMLIAVSGIPGPTVGFCTRDRFLSAFWTYLNAQDPTWSENNTFVCRLELSQPLFPRLNDDERYALLQRLKG